MLGYLLHPRFFLAETVDANLLEFFELQSLMKIYPQIYIKPFFIHSNILNRSEVIQSLTLFPAPNLTLSNICETMLKAIQTSQTGLGSSWNLKDMMTIS